MLRPVTCFVMLVPCHDEFYIRDRAHISRVFFGRKIYNILYNTELKDIYVKKNKKNQLIKSTTTNGNKDVGLLNNWVYAGIRVHFWASPLPRPFLASACGTRDYLSIELQFHEVSSLVN